MAQKEVKLLTAQVGHARLSPKKNAFLYRVFYVSLPVTKKMTTPLPKFFSLNKWNILSLRTADYVDTQNNTTWHDYITEELKKAKIPFDDTYNVTLITHPRLFGYAFNPISFWLITNANGNLTAVFCKVTNTFKQTHNYLLAKANDLPILPTDILTSKKNLYVSPFTKTVGYYEFTFSYTEDRFKAVINYFDDKGIHILNTYMGGTTKKLTATNILQSVLRYPFMTVMVVVRIHWQAVKLYCKKVKHTLKTRQKDYANDQTTIVRK